jgi:hypothetical protein
LRAMPISESQREQLLESTRGAAAALIEDLQHFREILKRPQPSRGELRRLSGVLRRLLVDRDISIIAAPRIARITFDGPDNKPYIKMARNIPFKFFGSGGANAFGVIIRAIQAHAGSPSMPIGFHPDKTVPLRLDNFLAQPVLCYDNKWVSRGDVIKYVANVASGVHSGTPKPKDKQAADLLDQMRSNVSYSANPIVSMRISPKAPVDASNFSYSPNDIDPALMELLATIHYLMKSKDVEKLEAIIKVELGVT